MPKIPQYQPQVEMPKETGEVAINERPFVDPYAGQAKMWGHVVELGDVAAKIVKADNTMKMTTAKLQMQSDLEKIQADFSTRTDHPNFAADYEKAKADLQEKYANQYPQIWQSVQPYFNAYTTHTGINVAAQARKLFIDEATGEMENNLKEFYRRAALAERGSEQEAIWKAEINNLLEDGVSVGVMHSKKAESVRRTMDQGIDEFRAEWRLAQATTAVQANDLKDWLLKKDADGNFVNMGAMSPEKFMHVLRTADERSRFLTNEMYTQNHRLQDQNRQNIWQMVDQGKPDYEIIAAVDRAMQFGPNGLPGLPQHEAFDLKEKIRTGTLRDVKTDYKTWDNLYTRIENGENVQADIGAAVAQGRLSVPNAMALRALVDRKLSGLDKQTQLDLSETLKTFKEKLHGIKDKLGDTSAEQEQSIGAVHSDAIMASDFVKGPKDLPWFREYLDRSLAAAEKNMGDDYRKKLTERNYQWYDKFMGENFSKTRRMGNIQTPPPGSTGAPDSPKVEEVKGIISTQATALGLRPSLMTAVAFTESGFNQAAVSPKGAQGTMQLMPDTAAGLKVNPGDLTDNIKGGVRYYSQMFKQFGNEEMALAAYNAGPGKPGGDRGLIPAIEKAQKKGGNWLSYMPNETQDYVYRVKAAEYIINSGERLTRKNVEYVMAQMRGKK